MISEDRSAGLTVILCCYNSADRIGQTLYYLAHQKIEALSWEILLIDNCSMDNTAEIAEGEWAKLKIKDVAFHILSEPKPGLSHARQCGIDNSKFDYVVFCDDDNWLDENYIQTAFYLLSKDQTIAAVGGRSEAVSEVEYPEWFESAKEHYAVGCQSSRSGDISARKYLWGSGISFRKDIYLRAFSQFPSLLTGRRGDQLTSGEDSEMCMRFILMGYHLFYSEDLRFKHYIPGKRLTREYDNQLLAGFEEAYEVLKIYVKFIEIIDLSLIKQAVELVKSALKYLLLNLTCTSRWKSEDEKLIIFIITGFKFKTIDETLVKIRELTFLK